MHRTRTGLATGLALALAIGLAPLATEAQTFPMKLATATLNDVQHEWMKRFKERMDARPDNKLKIDLFTGGQLGEIPRMIEGMQLGTIESFVSPSAFFVGVDPRNAVLTAPGLLQDINHCWRTMADKGLRDAWLPLMRDKGILAVSIMCSAPQAFITKRPIEKLDDFKGLKIRVLATDFEIKPMQTFGVAPTPMPFGEVMPALQQGLIDGVSSIPLLFNTSKMFTAAKHVTLTGLINWAVPVYVSRIWFEKLPADVQKAILDESIKVEADLIAWNDNANANTLVELKNNGVTITRLAQADQDRMLAGVRKAVGEVLDAARPGVKEMYQQISTIAAKHRR